jgi:hypothetical protein
MHLTDEVGTRQISDEGVRCRSAGETSNVDSGRPCCYEWLVLGSRRPGRSKSSQHGFVWSSSTCREDQMSEPVYKLWQARPTEAWYQLPKEEQDRLFKLVAEALEAVGGTTVVICSAGWSNEQWPFFGLEEFPDLEAVQRHQQMLVDFEWARYVESRTTLGTPSSPQ